MGTHTSTFKPNGTVNVDKAKLQEMFRMALVTPDLRESKDSLHSLSTLLRDNAASNERVTADVLYTALPEDMAKRLQSRRDTFISNCIGTALYIVGKVEKDAYIDPNVAHESYLKDLREIKTPVAASLVVWRDVEDGNIRVAHMGVVTAGNLIETSLVSYRFGYMSRFIENRTLSHMAKTYGEKYTFLATQ